MEARSSSETMLSTSQFHGAQEQVTNWGMLPSYMLRRLALVKNRRFGGKYRLRHQYDSDKNRRGRNNVSSK
jgi:hypothetical protein